MSPLESNSFPLAYHRGWLWAALVGMKTNQPTGMTHHSCWNLEVLLELEVFLPCSPCPSPAWGCLLGCLHPCSFSSVVIWMKPNQCYTHRLLLVKLTCCVLLFLVLGIFPFPRRPWVRRDMGGMLQPAPLLQPALSRWLASII